MDFAESFGKQSLYWHTNKRKDFTTVYVQENSGYKSNNVERKARTHESGCRRYGCIM